MVAKGLLHVEMKPPERWAPSCNMPSLSVFLPKTRQRMSRRHLTSWHCAMMSHDVRCHEKKLSHAVTSRDVMTLHHMMSYDIGYDKVNLLRSTYLKIRKSPSDLDLDPWPWPSNLSEILSRSIPPPNCLVHMFNGSASRALTENSFN